MLAHKLKIKCKDLTPNKIWQTFIFCEKGKERGRIRVSWTEKNASQLLWNQESSPVVPQCWGSCGKLVQNRYDARLMNLKFDLTIEEQECILVLKAQCVWSFTGINWWSPTELSGTKAFYTLPQHSNLSLVFIF